MVVNPNPQKKGQAKALVLEEFEQFKEDRIDRVKREKDALMNVEK